MSRWSADHRKGRVIPSLAAVVVTFWQERLLARFPTRDEMGQMERSVLEEVHRVERLVTEQHMP